MFWVELVLIKQPSSCKRFRLSQKKTQLEVWIERGEFGLRPQRFQFEPTNECILPPSFGEAQHSVLFASDNIFKC